MWNVRWSSSLRMTASTDDGVAVDENVRELHKLNKKQPHIEVTDYEQRWPHSLPHSLPRQEVREESILHELPAGADMVQ